MFDIDTKSEIPLGEQVRRAVRRAIAEGALRTGDPLPPVRKVAAKTGVNLNTVARAYRQLEEEGLVETVRGRGTEIKAVLAKKKISRKDLAMRTRDLAADAVLGGCSRRDVKALL